MPSFTISQKPLAKHLNTCSQVSQKKSDVEFFAYTKLTLSKDSLRVAAMNNNTFYHAHIPISNLDENIDSEIHFAIKTELLNGAVNLLVDEMLGVDFDIAKNTFTLQGSKGKHTLRIDPEMIKEYKDVVAISKAQAKILLSSEALSMALTAASIAVGQPKSTYDAKFLNVCLTVKPDLAKLFVVATDRYRISKTVIDGNYQEIGDKVENGTKQNFLFLPKGLQILNQMKENGEEMSVSFHDEIGIFVVGGVTLVLKYGDGDYPEYDRIIPQSFTCKFETEAKELLAGLRQVYLSARSNLANKTVNVEILPKENKIVLSAETEDGNKSESTLTLKNYEGIDDSWKQSFNADYLMDYLNVLQTEEMVWEANPGKPSVPSPIGEKEKQLYLVSGLK